MSTTEARAALKRPLVFGDAKQIAAIKFLAQEAEERETDCTACEGTGECTCSGCGADHECGRCDGTGKKES